MIVVEGKNTILLFASVNSETNVILLSYNKFNL